jgi:hypothetical protein
MAQWSDYFTPDIGGALPEAYGATAPIMDPVAGAVVGAIDHAATPGRIMQPNPYPKGSEEWHWYEGRRQSAMDDWAPRQALSMIGNPLVGAPQAAAGEVLAGSGAIRRAAKVNKPSDFVEPVGEANVGKQAGVDVGPGVGGGSGGEPGLAKAQAEAARGAGAYEPLPGLPQGPFNVGGEPYIAGPIGSVHDVAQDYMKTAGRPYERQSQYQKIDKDRARAIAQAFEDMKHAPNDPRVKASYDALINETRDQFRAIKNSGLRMEPITPEMGDPYAQTPRMATRDVRDNNHLYFFPTEQGFGTNPGGIDMSAHPMMQPSGETLNGRPLLNNDLFRVVHDYFGHVKEGHGFRGEGEDNAFQTHAKMYSDQARPAMATETRGQNSWLNYGPHGDTNRTASAADTHYADQKVGVMPPWTMRDNYYPGRVMPSDFFEAPHPSAPFPQYAERYPDVGPGEPTIDPKSGKEYLSKKLTPQAENFQQTRADIMEDMDKNGYQPYFDPAQRHYPDPSHYPPNLDTTQIVPKKQSTIDKDMTKIGAPDVRQRLQEAYARGSEMPDTKDWYAMGQLEKKFVDELGPVEGRKAFQERFATSMAATTGGAGPRENLLMSQYGNYLRTHGLPYPAAAHEMPFPIGGRYATTNMDMHQRVMDNGGFADLGDKNPKRHNFAQNFTGNRDAATIDEQMASGMTPGEVRPPVGKYGLYERVLREEAAKAGVPPANFQESAWAGFKGKKTPNYTSGKPMISEANDAIERTHRLTGMSRDEIVKRGFVRGEIPLYGVGGAAALAPFLQDQGRPDSGS